MLTYIVALVCVVVYLVVTSHMEYKRTQVEMERFWNSQEETWEQSKRRYHELHLNNTTVFDRGEEE